MIFFLIIGHSWFIHNIFLYPPLLVDCYETQNPLVGMDVKLSYQYVYYSHLQLNQKPLHILCNCDLSLSWLSCVLWYDDEELPHMDSHPRHEHGLHTLCGNALEGIVLGSSQQGSNRTNIRSPLDGISLFCTGWTMLIPPGAAHDFEDRWSAICDNRKYFNFTLFFCRSGRFSCPSELEIHRYHLKS